LYYLQVISKQRVKESCPAQSNWVLTFDIPDRFTKKTMRAISTGDVGKSPRSEIVSALHSRMLQFKDFPTSFEYKKACERLVEKYPVLVDKSSSGYVSCLYKSYILATYTLLFPYNL
jgi:hypothetical protein